MKKLLEQDPLLAKLIAAEELRQETTITLIASENYAPYYIREIEASSLSNKYAEGYPHARYYAGCEIIDQIEELAISRCKNLFLAEHANVQPHAGSQANAAVYTALLKPGDTLMGMSLSAGGHLTHGHPVSSSGMIYRSISYGVDPETEQLDYDALARQADKERPKLIIAGASAYSRRIDFKKIGAIAKEVNAFFLADIAHIAGLVATGLHESPVTVADCITSTTHKTLAGPRGAFILSRAEHAKKIDRAVMPGIQGGPFMQAIAAKAYTFAHAQTESFKQYQKTILANAHTLCSALQSLGYRIVSGGTDTHLFTIDLTKKNMSGLQAEQVLARSGINVSRSMLPYDSRPPALCSGIRLGTPAVTARGMQETEMVLLAEYINALLSNPDTSKICHQTKRSVQLLCQKFPLVKRKWTL